MTVRRPPFSASYSADADVPPARYQGDSSESN
jgi:hypothetical protein